MVELNWQKEWVNLKIEFAQAEKQSKKDGGKWIEPQRKWNIITHTNIHTPGVPEKRKRRRKNFKEIMSINFPIVLKNNSQHIQKLTEVQIG